MQDNIMELYNRGHSLKYIIDSELIRLKHLKSMNPIEYIDLTPTLKTARENVESTIYNNLMKLKRKGES